MSALVGRLVRRLLGPVGVALGPPAAPFFSADLREEAVRPPMGIDLPPGTRLLVVEPLRSAEGLAVGSLVIADGSPRHLSARDRESLRDIAALLSAASGRGDDDESIRADRAERMLDLSQEGFALAERGILLDVSPAMARLFKVEPHRLIGRSVLELVFPEQHDDFMRLMSAERTSSLETLGVRPEGGTFPMEVRHHCLPGDAMCTLNFRDITQQRQRDQQRSEFFTGMGHELRTPLGSLRAALGLLRRRGLPEESRALVQIAQTHAESLARLVSDLVDHESILSGRVLLTLTPVDALTLVSQATRNAQPRAAEREVALVFDHTMGRRRVLADTVRLGQAFSLLLEHAVRCAPRGSVVEARAKGEDDRVTLQIDFGAPPPDPPSRLFEAFTDTDMGPDLGSGHLRLGLSLARAILRRHGGEVDAMDNGEGGTRLEARLAVWRAPPEPSVVAGDERADVVILGGEQTLLLCLLLHEAGIGAVSVSAHEQVEEVLTRSQARVLVLCGELSPPSAVPSAVKILTCPPDPQSLAAEVRALLEREVETAPKVLYVEDDPDHAELMVAILAGVVETHSVGTLAEARAALRRQTYRVVLTDIGLPDGNGLELVQELQAMGPDGPRVIVFSARTVDKAMPVGVRVLTKASVTNDELRAAVVSML